MARDYSVLKYTRWYGTTGSRLSQAIQSREKGDPSREAYKDAQILMDVLIANPNANMWGLYYIDREMVTDLSGLTHVEVDAAFEILKGEQFACYEKAFVWVREMARYQLNLPLQAGDTKIKMTNTWYSSLPQNPFLGQFYDRYAADLWLKVRRAHYTDEPPELVTNRPGLPANGNGRMSITEMQFLMFLEAYPSEKRQGGREAEEAFAEAMANKGDSDEFLEQMFDALHYQKLSEAWRKEKRFIPSMVRWLREQHWRRDLSTGQSRLLGGPRYECRHGTCRGPGQHAMRVELEHICEHEPKCETVIDHYNRDVEDADDGAAEST